MSEVAQQIIEKVPMLILVLISIAQFLIIIFTGDKKTYEKLEMKKQKIINKMIANVNKSNAKIENLTEKQKKLKGEVKNDKSDDNRPNNEQNQGD